MDDLDDGLDNIDINKDDSTDVEETEVVESDAVEDSDED